MRCYSSHGVMDQYNTFLNFFIFINYKSMLLIITDEHSNIFYSATTPPTEPGNRPTPRTCAHAHSPARTPHEQDSRGNADRRSTTVVGFDGDRCRLPHLSATALMMVRRAETFSTRVGSFHFLFFFLGSTGRQTDRCLSQIVTKTRRGLA
jgi:hypothetical protein